MVVVELFLVEANGLLILLLPSFAELDECDESVTFIGLVVGNNVVYGAVSFVSVVEVLVDVLRGFQIEGKHEHAVTDIERIRPYLLESLYPLLKSSNLAV